MLNSNIEIIYNEGKSDYADVRIERSKEEQNRFELTLKLHSRASQNRANTKCLNGRFFGERLNKIVIVKKEEVKESELSKMINDYNLILNVINTQIHTDQAVNGLCNTLEYLLNKIKEYKTTTVADGIQKMYFIANLIHEQTKQGIFIEEDLASTMLSSIEFVINQ